MLKSTSIKRYRLRQAAVRGMNAFEYKGKKILLSHDAATEVATLSLGPSKIRTRYMKPWQKLLTNIFSSKRRRVQLKTWSQFGRDLESMLGVPPYIFELRHRHGRQWVPVRTIHDTRVGWIVLAEHGRGEGEVHKNLSLAIRSIMYYFEYEFELLAKVPGYFLIGKIDLREVFRSIAYLIGIVLALLLALVLPFLVAAIPSQITSLLSPSVKVAGIILALLIGYGFFKIKTSFGWLYGVIEIGVAIALIWNALGDVSYKSRGTEFTVKVMTGIYILVRGATNIFETITKVREKRRSQSRDFAVSENGNILYDWDQSNKQ